MLQIINSLAFTQVILDILNVSPAGLINVQRLRIEDRLTDLNNKPIDVSIHLMNRINHPQRIDIIL